MALLSLFIPGLEADARGCFGVFQMPRSWNIDLEAIVCSN